MTTLNVEVWRPEILDNFYQENSFLQDGMDVTSDIDADKLNLAEAGVDFPVYKNPTYPLTMSGRTDLPKELVIDEYVVGAIKVSDAEIVELNYDKKANIVKNVRLKLAEEMATEGQWNIAPTTNASSPGTPFIKSTGAAGTGGRKMMHKKDLASMARAFDKLKYPKAGRVALMDADAFWDFVDSDTNLQQQYAYNTSTLGIVRGAFLNYYGWEIRQREGSAWYTPTNSGNTFTKMAYGSTPGVNDLSSVTFYVKQNSFAVGMGSTKLYERLNDPIEQADIFSFRQRGIILPLRQKVLGALILVP